MNPFEAVALAFALTLVMLIVIVGAILQVRIIVGKIHAAVRVAPKADHRCRYVYRTSERTNKQLREISTCEVPGCRSAQLKVTPEDPSSDSEEFQTIAV